MQFPSGATVGGAPASKVSAARRYWTLDNWDMAAAKAQPGTHIVSHNNRVMSFLSDGTNLWPLPADAPCGLYLDTHPPTVDGRVLDELSIGAKVTEGDPVDDGRQLQPGRCVDLDGIDDYIIADNITRPVFPFACCCWFNQAAAATATIMSIADKSRADEHFAIYMDASGALVVRRQNASESEITVKTGLSPNRWYHVTVNFISATHVQVCLDGSVVYDDSGIASRVVSNDYDVFVIGMLRVTNPTWYFNGKLFDVRYYGRALTESEVAVIAATSRPGCLPQVSLGIEGLLHHWALDDGEMIFRDRASNVPAFLLNGSALTLHEGSDVPFSWHNESGYTPIERHDYPELTSMDAEWTSFTIQGSQGAGFASLGGTYLGQEVLGTVLFNDGALAGYSVNRVATNTLFSSEVNRCYIGRLEIATSRPIASGEVFRCYYTGVGSLCRVDLTESRQPGPGKFGTYNMTLVSLSAVGGLAFFIFPGTNVTGGDITFYVKSVSAYDTGKDCDPGEDYITGNDTYRYGELAPPNSLVPSEDIDGNVLHYDVPAPRNAKLINSFCGTFDAVDDIIDIDSATMQAVFDDHYSFAAWVKHDGTDWAAMIGWYVNPWGMTFLVDNEGYFRLYHDSAVNRQFLSFPVPQDTWLHVALVVDDYIPKLYINGKKLEEQTAVSAITPPTAGVALGGYATDGTGAWGGSMHSVRLFARSLTDGEIESVFLGSATLTDEIGHWAFSEGAGNVVYDVSGNDNHGTAQNISQASFWSQDNDQVHCNAARGFSVQNANGLWRTFNGVDQYYEIEDNDDLSIAGNVNAWWCGVATPSRSGIEEDLFSKLTPAGAQQEWRIYRNGSNSLTFQVSSDGSTATGNTSSDTMDQDKNRFWFAYHDAETNEICVVIEDEPFSATPHSTGAFDSNSPTRIGARSDDARFFEGAIQLTAMGKPGASPDWDAIRHGIRDAIWHGPYNVYNSLVESQISSWGIVAWYEMDGFSRRLEDYQANNHMVGHGFAMVPCRSDVDRAADGRRITSPAGPEHNGAESEINFVGDQSLAPWLATNRGYSSVTAGSVDVAAAASAGSGTSYGIYSRVRVAAKGSEQAIYDASGGGALSVLIEDATGIAVVTDGSDTLELGTPEWGAWNDLAVIFDGTTVKGWLNGVYAGETEFASAVQDLSALTTARVLSQHDNHLLKSLVGDVARFRLVAGPTSIATLMADAALVDIYFDTAAIFNHVTYTELVVAGDLALTVIVTPTMYYPGDTLPDAWSKDQDGLKESRFACPAEVE